MSEVRRDIVTDTWVIIDTENDSIPEVVREDKAAVVDCPFCEGQERRTPTEIYAVRESRVNRMDPAGRCGLSPI